MWNNKVIQNGLQLAKDISSVYWALIKIMVPATIMVKVLDAVGATEWLSQLLGPVMQLVGLPEEMGLVWAVAILTNIYMGMITFYNFAMSEVVTIAEVSILGTMILIAHAIPVEGAVAKAVGVKWRTTIIVRIGGAIVLGAILNQIYSGLEIYQQPINLIWQPELNSSPTFTQWTLDQIQLFLSVLVIIAALMTALRILRWLGIEALIHKLLNPLLRGLTLGKEAANITIVGMTLGISYGAGLLIEDVRQGKISKRDTVLVIGFLGLCHSIIEDTLLILLLGADINAILWARLLFAIICIGIWGRLYKKQAFPSSSATQS